MTLFKQVALAVSLIIILMLGSVMYINYESAKQDMIDALYENTVNNISTLSNKLADAEDEASIISIIDSEFDAGYYKLIEFRSSDANFEYTQLDNEKVENVPLWFIEITNINLESITSDVSSGWSVIGELTLEGDTSTIYKALYKTFIKLLYLFIILVSIAHIALSILLHYVLKPLKLIQSQAEAILNNEFVIQEKEPYTTEFKEVVKGMNSMVKRVEDIFDRANLAAAKNRELLYNDPITKLYNRRYLMLKLPDLIKSENRVDGGTLIFAAFNSLELILKLIGRQNAEGLLFEFAQILQVTTEEFEEKVLARVNETEFSILLPACEASEAEKIVEEINTKFTTLLTKYEVNKKELMLHFGLYRYKPSVTVPDLLTKADNALSNAQSLEKGNFYIHAEKDDEHAMGKEQWRVLLEEVMSKERFHLKFWLTMNVSEKKVVHKIMTFTIEDAAKKSYAYGSFIPPAINLGMVSRLYNVAIKELFTKEHSELKDSLCSVRLSNEFLKTPNALESLAKLFEKSKYSRNFHLIFEVADSFAVNNTHLLKTFVKLFNQYNFQFGIHSFTNEASDMSYLKELNPVFIKADVSFLLDQTEESMNGLHTITDSLGIDIIASFVKNKEELEALEKREIKIVQGPITDKI